MKKLLGLLSLLCIVGGFSMADDLAYVSLDYCDTQDSVMKYQLDPGVETGICYMLSNNAKNPVTIKLSFVDGTFTNDQWQNKACLSDADTENFGRYVTDYEELLTLNPGESVRKEAKLMYPKGMDGLYYGCVVYSVVEAQPANEGMGTSFTILMRRAKFLDVIVGDPANAQEKGILLEDFTDEDRENLSHNSKIRIYQDSSDDKYVMQIKVKNISRTQQDVTITGTALNVIGIKNTFIETRKILKGESLLITKKFDTLPLYNLKLKLDITNSPMTFGDIKPILGHLKEKTNIWIWNIVTLITIVGILIITGIIILLIKDIKRRKNVKVKIKIIHDHTSNKSVKKAPKKIIKKRK